MSRIQINYLIQLEMHHAREDPLLLILMKCVSLLARDRWFGDQHSDWTSHSEN